MHLRVNNEGGGRSPHMAIKHALRHAFFLGTIDTVTCAIVQTGGEEVIGLTKTDQ